MLNVIGRGCAGSRRCGSSLTCVASSSSCMEYRPGAHAQEGEARGQHPGAARIRQSDPPHVHAVRVLLRPHVVVHEIRHAARVAADGRTGMPVPVVLVRPAAQPRHRRERRGHGELHAQAREFRQPLPDGREPGADHDVTGAVDGVGRHERRAARRQDRIGRDAHDAAGEALGPDSGHRAAGPRGLPHGAALRHVVGQVADVVVERYPPEVRDEGSHDQFARPRAERLERT